MSDKTPMWPIGSIFSHKASGERALLVHVDTWTDDRDCWSYKLSYGIEKLVVLDESAIIACFSLVPPSPACPAPAESPATAPPPPEPPA